MAHQTLLDAVNEILTRTGIIHGDSGLLTSLTSTARQRSIDIAIQVVNEGIDELYSACGVPMPDEQAESTITLVAGTRSYALASDLVQMRFPLIDKTNTQYIFEYPGGYNAILVQDPEQDDEGLPQYAAVSPVNSELYLDRAPAAEDAGKIYTYQYDKDVELTTVGNTVPFSDAVFRAMVPVWVQLWRRDQQNEFDGDLFRLNIGRAARLLPKQQPRDNYSPRG